MSHYGAHQSTSTVHTLRISADGAHGGLDSGFASNRPSDLNTNLYMKYYVIHTTWSWSMTTERRQAGASTPYRVG